MSFSAKVIADSINEQGNRLTTMVLRYPRFIHAEFMTHRVFSRNASSSRAIPVEKMIRDVSADPAMPVYWGKNKPGMQAEEELTGRDREEAEDLWLEALEDALGSANLLRSRGVHKQITNRLLEPWMHISVICTATEWANFYSLRCDPAAQPEMRVLAETMLEAHNASTPKLLKSCEWHLPFVSAEELQRLGLDTARKCSVARCARVSYNNHDGSEPNVEKDMVLHDRLAESRHVSPFEHQATPKIDPLQFALRYGLKVQQPRSNFRGWIQYRSEIKNENVTQYERLLVRKADG